MPSTMTLGIIFTHRTPVVQPPRLPQPEPDHVASSRPSRFTGRNTIQQAGASALHGFKLSFEPVCAVDQGLPMRRLRWRSQRRVAEFLHLHEWTVTQATPGNRIFFGTARRNGPRNMCADPPPGYSRSGLIRLAEHGAINLCSSIVPGRVATRNRDVEFIEASISQSTTVSKTCWPSIYIAWPSDRGPAICSWRTRALKVARGGKT